MTQKSLVYMVIAVAVGYILVSAVPQQVSMYTTPPRMLSTSNDTYGVETVPKLGEGDAIPESGDTSSDLNALETQRGDFEEPSFLELSRLPELMKWWTLDIIIALSIYWVARRSLS